MASSCQCCGYPKAQDYGSYIACRTCAPSTPEIRIFEAVAMNGDRPVRAKIQVSTYRCTSELCKVNRPLHVERKVIEWLE